MVSMKALWPLSGMLLWLKYSNSINISGSQTTGVGNLPVAQGWGDAEGGEAAWT